LTLLILKLIRPYKQFLFHNFEKKNFKNSFVVYVFYKLELFILSIIINFIKKNLNLILQLIIVVEQKNLIEY